MPFKTLKSVSKSLFGRNESTIFLDPLTGSSLRSPTERWRNSVDHIEVVDDDDMISILTMETIDDNIGAGRTLSKYLFRPAGLSLEKLLNKILGPTLATPFAIGYQLQHFLQYDFDFAIVPSLFGDTLSMTVRRLRLEKNNGGMGTVSGLERLCRLYRCVEL